jgi:hypothetical protein
MDKGILILSTAFTIVSVKGIIYLYRYFLLFKFGVTIAGEIKSFDLSQSVLNKNAAIPKVFFVTLDKKEIFTRPVLSFLFPVNNYAFKKDCLIMYDSSKPARFVIKNDAEPIYNILFIIATIGLWIYQLL